MTLLVSKKILLELGMYPHEPNFMSIIEEIICIKMQF